MNHDDDRATLEMKAHDPLAFDVDEPEPVTLRDERLQDTWIEVCFDDI